MFENFYPYVSLCRAVEDYRTRQVSSGPKRPELAEMIKNTLKV